MGWLRPETRAPDRRRLERATRSPSEIISNEKTSASKMPLSGTLARVEQGHCQAKSFALSPRFFDLDRGLPDYQGAFGSRVVSNEERQQDWRIPRVSSEALALTDRTH